MATSNRLRTWTLALASIGDPEGTRAVGSIILLLIALGLTLVMVAVWLFKSTRPDPELLAPLEVMGERRWRRADPVWQRRRLDDVRPDGAVPLEPSVAPPDVDEAFDRGPVASGFDDLHADQPEDVPTGPAFDPPAPDAVVLDTPTPEALPRPVIDELPDHEIDPDLLAAAMAELEAELGERRASERGSQGDAG